jgi:diguanylate cyclase (GGDEF)-like protein
VKLRPGHKVEGVGPARAPRLVLRFALLTALGLAVAGAVILLVVRYLDVRQAEREAISRARLVTEAVLLPALVPDDVRNPVERSRRARLDGLLSPNVTPEGTMRISVVRSDGLITYSTDRRLIGRRSPIEGLVRATTGGQTMSTSASVSGREADASPVKALVTLVPVVVGSRARGAGAVAIVQRYSVVAQAANDAFLPIAGVLELVFLGLFLLLVPTLASASTRIRRHAGELEHRASHDALTGLPNRTNLQRDVGRVVQVQSGGPVALFFIDLDQFRRVNDALGHASGNDVLIEVSRRLALLAPDGLVMRLGGDEFAVVTGVVSTADALAFAGRIRASVEQPIMLSGVPVHVSSSVGVALLPDHAEDAEKLLRHADVAAHVAKQRGSRIATYDPHDDKNSVERLALLAELREAIERRQLEVWFQPVATMANGAIRGAEALVRWPHGERGLLEAKEFVPLAEQTGLTRPLTSLVLDKALACWREWHESGVEIDVFVNVSVADLVDGDFPDEVEALLERHAVPPQRLVLEITETAAMSDSDRARDVLVRLRRLGVRRAIDDFGTGYSSLAHLHRLPVNVIKIDRSFVATMLEDATAAAIVHSTIELGQILGLDVIAEGVETEAQWERLLQLRCTYAQGYLIARPCGPTGFRTLLQRGTGRSRSKKRALGSVAAA